MKTKIIFFVLFMMAGYSFSQQWSFVDTIANTSYTQSVKLADDGSVYLVVTSGENKVDFVKYDNNDSLLWRKSMSASSDLWVHETNLDASGKLWFVGNASGTLTVGTQHYTDPVFLGYITPQGDSIRIIDDYSGVNFSFLRLDALGNIWVGGTAYSNAAYQGTPLGAKSNDVLLARFNNQGDTLAHYLLGDTNTQVLLGMDYVGETGKIYLCGSFTKSMNAGLFAISNSSTGYFSMQVDSSGVVEFLHAIDIKGNFSVKGMVAATDSTIFIYGARENSGDFSIGGVSYELTYSDDFMMAAFENNGEVKWAKVVSEYSADELIEEAVLVEDTLYLAGHTTYQVTIQGEEVANPTFGNNALFMLMLEAKTGNEVGLLTASYTAPASAKITALDYNGMLVVAGYQSGTVSYDTMTRTANHAFYSLIGKGCPFSKPTVDFSFTETNYGNIYFTNNSTNAGRFLWNFGDGATSDKESVNHIFAKDTTYQVVLNAYKFCASASITKPVVVTTAGTKKPDPKVFCWNFQGRDGGSTGYDESSSATGMTFDNSGNLLVVGNYKGSLTVGSYTLPYLTADSASVFGRTAAFIVNMTTDTIVNWASYIRTNGTVIVEDVAVANNGKIGVVGMFSGTLKAGVVSKSSASATDKDVFIAIFASNGQIEYIATGGSTNADKGNAITVDTAGNFYITGMCYGNAMFDVTSFGANPGFFVAKYDQSAGLQWLKPYTNSAFFVPEGRDIAYQVSSNNVIVSARFSDSFTFGSMGLVSSKGENDIFLGALKTADGAEQWKQTYGGAGADGEGLSIGVDVSGIYMTGSYRDSAVFGAFTAEARQQWYDDYFIMNADETGNVQWLDFIGGEYNSGSDLTVADDGIVYVAGSFTSGEYLGSIDQVKQSGWAIPAYSVAGTYLWLQQPLSSSNYNTGSVTAIIADADSNVYICGEFSDTLRFQNNLPPLYDHVSAFFIAKLGNSKLVTGNNKNDEVPVVSGSLAVYPNPASEFIWFASENKCEYEIYEMNGRRVLQGKENQVNVSGLAEGIYIISVNDGVKTNKTKLLIRR